MLPTKSHAVNVRSSQVYKKSFSKKHILFAALFMSILIFYLLISSQNTWVVYQEKYLQARNDTHLLSNNEFTSCQGHCQTPPVKDLEPKQIFEACLDKGKSPEYYLSIILVSRNDNYANFQYERFQNMLDSTFLLAQGTKTRLELLIVEWNPEKTKRLIKDTYRLVLFTQVLILCTKYKADFADQSTCLTEY